MTDPYFASPYFTYPFSYLWSLPRMATVQDQIDAFATARASLAATIAATGPVAEVSADGKSVARYRAVGVPPLLEITVVPIAGTVALPTPPAPAPDPTPVPVPDPSANPG
jgi:hypothetical protein